MSSSQPQQQSLYRRHRPRTFADVVGQEPVVRTLRHAVERGQVHHAYLFVGSRGTGKTSMAKILAACLNCERGPTIEPCGVCDSCVSIASATSLDVIEMDAASNNSVDDIRELRESVAFAPVSGRQKVYILDEAHMLSSSAWNAFLKTLEEPPPGTVFVLATTEAHKVPPTVVDRCHRFDFHRPTVEQIAGVIRRAAQAESIEIPPEAVAAVSRAATGSFRDALGTLEQLVTYSGAEIALTDVLAVLGVTDSRVLDEIFDAINDGDPRRVLLAVGESAQGGRDPASLASDLEIRARELMVVQTLGEVPPELSLTPDADTRLAEQAARLGPAIVLRVLELLGGALEAIRASGDSRTQVELALVKAARPEVDGSTRALLARIERLEQRGAGAGGAEPAVSVAPPVGTSGSPAEAQLAAPSPPVGASRPSEPAVPVAGAQSVEPTRPAGAAQPAVPTRPAVAEAPAATDREPIRPPQGSGGSPAVAAVVEESVVATLDPVVPGVEDLAYLSSIWSAVVDLVRSENALLGALIDEARPVHVADRELTVGFASTASFLKKKAEDPAHRATVGRALREVSGLTLRVEYELRDELPLAPEGTREPTPSGEEWVSRFMDEFDAEEIPGEWVPQPSEKEGE